MLKSLVNIINVVKEFKMTLNMRPIAFDSLGVRSMATYISTSDVGILIDPSASLAPMRYGLPPHEVELKALTKYVDEIKYYLGICDVVIITHYHYDHHDPGKLVPIELFRSKKVLVKDPLRNINTSQRIRAHNFLRKLKEVTTFEVADGNTFKFGKTEITVSRPVPHGNTNKLGYVIMIRITCEGRSIAFSSDVEGPLDEYAVEFLSGSDVIIVDGPPTYLAGNSYSRREIEEAVNNLVKLSLRTKKLIVDHHLLRDLNYRSIFDQVDKSSGIRPLTAADYLGLEPNLLEARRRELYGIKLDDGSGLTEFYSE